MSAGGAATARAALLEEFAEACTVVARGLAPKDHDVQWENGKDGFVHFHCPLTGLNGAHTWTGAPRACAWVKGDQVEAWCTKCVGDKKTFPDQATYDTARAAYTDAVKRAIRWEQDGVVHVGFKTITVRSHLYFDRDFRHAIRRDKVRYEDGRKEKGNTNPWRWRVAALANGAPGAFAPMRAEPWLAANYPEHDVIYNALCWYSIDLFIDPAGSGAPTASTLPLKPAYRVVLTEGEHDADSFNMLMAGAGNTENIATCLCHPKPTKFASHHARLVAGRDVVIVGDADDPGKDQAENWASILWGQPSSVKIVRDQLGLSGTPDDKDLTDWIVKRLGPPAEWLTKIPTVKAVAAELLNLFASTAPLMEPPGRPTEWRSDMIAGKNGTPKADSPHNAERVWTLHPGLKGKVRTNVRSGEVEVIDPPWGGGIVVGARKAALDCAMWLEKTEKVSLSTRTLEDVLASDRVAPPHNPLQGLLDATWDGVPRLDGLFTTYVPLDVEPNVAVALARVTMGDLVRKMRNELVGQKLLVGVATDLDLDVAGALLGLRGHQHRGKVNDHQVAQFARLEKMAVQMSMEPVANRQAALASLPCIFSPYTSVGGRLISSPLFLAVGIKPVDPRTDGKVDERCYLYDLVGRARLDSMCEDADQLAAEAVARLDELTSTIVPSKSQTLTIDAREGIESVRHTLEGLHVYATQDPAATDIGSTRSIRRAPTRLKPIQHIVRAQFLDVMRVWMLDAYRDVHAQELAFNAACRAMGWVKTGKPVALSLYKTKAAELGWDIGGRDCATVPGVLLTSDRLKELSDRLFDIDPSAPSGGPTPPPKGGGVEGAEHDDGSTIPNDSSTIVAESSKTAGYDTTMEALVPLELSQNEIAAPARARTFDSKERKGPGYREGSGAVAEAGSILSTPGWCAIDFETWPTATAWHGDDAAERAPRGGKGQARADAVLAAQMGGRAKQRRACTIQLHHEDGSEVFIRLDPGDADAPRERQLQAMFEGRVADLCAHNAQFETEVLLKHGVAADVDCTMLAAKALYLTAVGDDRPQPVSFGLAALVAKDLGRTRDKTVRDRDWRLKASLDDEAIEYGLQDARDCLELWQLYRTRLEAEGLFDGYRIMQRALLPTAATNLTGLALDATAHAVLMRRMAEDAQRLEAELGFEAMGDIENHGSPQQVSTWIMEQVLDTPIKPPAEPKLVGLVDFLVGLGGLRPVGELRDMPKRLIAKRGLGLDDAANQAAQAGYIGRMRDYGQRETDVEDASPDELVRAVERDLAGDRVLTMEDDQKWRDYLAAKEHFDRLHRDDPYRLSHFVMRLVAKTGGAVKGWRTTKTGHLQITKGGKLRKAEQLAAAFPHVSKYLVKHAQWTKATKLLDSFGPTLRRWQDDDGRCRGQFRVWASWTGRQSCVDPNLQNQPREDEFRALWVAPPGRKLVIADYSQIELRLAAIESGDERLREVYREGRDVHSETASIITAKPLDQVTKADRQPAKGVNFLSVYGGGASKLAETIGCDLEEAHMILARFFAAYPGLATYRERMPEEAAKQRFIAIKPGRRVLYDPEISSPTQSINAPIQGGAASVQMLAMRLLHDALKAREKELESFTVASVHDEFLVETPADHRADEVSKILVDCMVRALLEIFPEAEDMGMARLTAAAVCDRWSQKP